MFRPVAILCFAYIGGAAVAAEAPRSQDENVSEAFSVLGKVNRASELEPAGSRGSMGLGVGAGMTRSTVPEQNPVLAAQLGDDSLDNEDAAGTTVDVPRVWVVKGLPMPVDVGFSGGKENGSGITQASGYAQWTIYEALAMPAIAVRGSYGRLFGLEGLGMTTTGVEALAGMGLLRYFTFFGRAGIYQHKGELSIDQESNLAFTLVDGEEEKTVTRGWSETVMGTGLRIMILPPFVSLTGEMEWSSETNGRDFAAKLGFGM